jgi:putative transposase
MTTRDIRAHLREIYGVEVSPDLISRVTDAVIDELAKWQARPLDQGLSRGLRRRAYGEHPRRGGHQPGGVRGHRHRLRGRQAAPGPVDRPCHRESSAKFCLSVLSELKGRGVADVCIVCCDGLTGLPDAIGVVWAQAVVQLCVIHLIPASLRYGSRKHSAPLARDLQAV